MTRPVWSRVLGLPGSGLQRFAIRARHVAVIAVVAALAGFIFTTSAQLARSEGSTSRRASDLAGLVQTGSDRVEELTTSVEGLQRQVSDLESATTTAAIGENPQEIEREGIAAGSVAVSGPGVRVELSDAPESAAQIPNVTVDNLVIHQQDLQHVINALWAGGAEAMTLMGERVTQTTAFRCVGNVLYLHGRVFSPPFVVEAIGSPRLLQASVNASPGVQIFLEYVDWLGLGFSMMEQDLVEVPAAPVLPALKYAVVPAGVNPLR